MVFIRNKKMPRTVVFRRGGETETSVTNRIPNQVSARINNDNIINEFCEVQFPPKKVCC